ncbi:MAG: hypothetical protein ACLU6B_02560 [Lachnospirales bacterium]
MRLSRFIPRRTVVFVLVVLLFVYCALWMMGWANASHYCFFQHPFYTMAVYGGFYIFLYRFDFWNSFWISRFESIEKCLKETCIATGKMVIGYITILCVLLYPIAWILQDQITGSIAALHYIYTTLSLILLCYLYIVLGYLFHPIVSKAILIAGLFVGISISFFGEFYITVNFPFYNMNTQFSPLFLLQTGCVYMIVGCISYMLSRRGMEL